MAKATKKAVQRPGAARASEDLTPDPTAGAGQDAAPADEAPAVGGEALQAKANRLNRAQLGPDGWLCPQPKPKAA